MTDLSTLSVPELVEKATSTLNEICLDSLEHPLVEQEEWMGQTSALFVGLRDVQTELARRAAERDRLLREIQQDLEAGPDWDSLNAELDSLRSKVRDLADEMAADLVEGEPSSTWTNQHVYELAKRLRGLVEE